MTVLKRTRLGLLGAGLVIRTTVILLGKDAESLRFSVCKEVFIVGNCD